MSDITRGIIAGTGSYLPEKVLTNLDLEKMVDTSDEWIYTRTGIRERHVADENTAVSDLAIAASKAALESAGIKPSDVNLIITATITPDYIFPSTSCLIQHALGAENAGGFDLEAACAGFVYGTIVADAHIRVHPDEVVLVIGAETLTKITDYTDRSSCILFGDGAGAAVMVGSNDGRGLLASEMGVDGSGGEIMMIQAGGSRTPTTKETVEKRLHYMKIRGREVFRFAVIKMEELVRNAVEKAGCSTDDIKLIVPHQVNIRILKASAERLGLPMEKIYVNIDRCGNTSAASVPIALDEACRSGMFEQGDLVVLVAFGGGLSWSSCLIRW